MDIFMKVLLLLFGLGFGFISYNFLFRAKRVIQAIQKQKFQTTAEPRKQELIMSRVIGVLLGLVGIYFIISALVALFA